MVNNMYYINLFFIYSLLGFLFENFLNIITNATFNSGVLYGPWTFIYGIAIFLILFLNKLLKKFKLKKWLEIILFYLFITILMTLIEFSGGMLIEKLFHRTYWDYTNMKYNYGPYICLEISLLWGLFATFVNYLIMPKISKLAQKIPKIITIIFLILFIIDIIATILN